MKSKLVSKIIFKNSFYLLYLEGVEKQNRTHLCFCEPTVNLIVKVAVVLFLSRGYAKSMSCALIRFVSLSLPRLHLCLFVLLCPFSFIFLSFVYVWVCTQKYNTNSVQSYFGLLSSFLPLKKTWFKFTLN